MEGKIPVERFNGSDFRFWRMQMEAYLYGKDLYGPLAEKPEKTSDEEWKVLDRKAMSAIIMSLSRNVAYNMKGAKSTKEVLQTLADMYKKPSAMNKVMLMKKLFRLQMEERKSVADHLNDFNQLTTQLASVDIVFDDEVKALILLSSLPDSWDVVVTSVSTSSGKEKMKFDNIRDMMLNEETRRKQTGGSSGSALHTESRGRLDTRGKYRGRSRSRGKNKVKKEMVCWNYEKPGHMKSECRAPEKEKEGRTANAVIEEITDALLLSVSSSSDDWVVDSGASFHSCSNKDIMEPYTSGDFGLVYLADNKPLKIVGKGDVRIKSTNGSCWILHDVRHIPELKSNLISVGQLDNDGFHTTFGDAKWKISRGAMTMARGLKSGMLYMAEGSNSNIPFAGTKRVSFLTTGKTLRKEKLELVHTDLWGPAPVSSLGGSTRWRALVENETGLQVKCLRLDNGGEYSSEGIKNYWADRGIRIQKTIPGTTQQNGIAERMNRRLNERARCIEERTAKDVLGRCSQHGCFIDQSRAFCPAEQQDTRRGLEWIMRPADTDLVGVQTDETEQMEIEPEPASEEQIAESSTPLALGREPMLRRAPDRYSPSLYYFLLSDCGEPECYAEAVNDAHKSKWELVMNDEMNSLKKNDTWEFCQLPKGKKALQNRWVYRVKDESDGKKQYKARLIVKGFQQRYGIDFIDVFTPVVKLTTIRLVLSMVATENLELQQMDVKTAFLHGDLEEEIYMVQPEGSNGDDQQVCRLKKILYGLKQAPRQWYRKFDNFMLEIGFSRCNDDYCSYVKRFDDFFIILLLYVDDMLIAGSNVKEINRLKDQLSRRFDMKDLGEARQILGMKITRDKSAGKLWLSQSDYIEKTDSERAKMRVTPYASAIGSLMYAMICTRSDIAHSVGVYSRFISNPGVMHWEAVKWILRYLRGTKDRALVFGKGKLTLFGFVDADFVGSDYDRRRSTTGYVFTYDGELGKPQADVVLHSNSQSAIHLVKNHAFHSRTKHIEIKYHFIRQLLEKKALQLEKIQGEKNPADILTKAVAMEKLKLCTALTGLDD
ncbi:UNVERIFIED_CONTAM: Retrovirus-related Pol polyprotein from transposon TNT 1-94 [Sesamum indicum]